MFHLLACWEAGRGLQGRDTGLLSFSGTGRRPTGPEFLVVNGLIVHVEFSRYRNEYYGLVCCLNLLMVRGILDGQENSGQLGGAGYVQGVFKSLGWCTEDVWCIYSENEICRK